MYAAETVLLTGVYVKVYTLVTFRDRANGHRACERRNPRGDSNRGAVSIGSCQETRLRGDSGGVHLDVSGGGTGANSTFEPCMWRRVAVTIGTLLTLSSAETTRIIHVFIGSTVIDRDRGEARRGIEIYPIIIITYWEIPFI